ncbi:hypothetical protein [Streptomyces sp. NPDC059708]|uniref:hypothetical protein n=1 Tax=Streptomyces sp. NPDC059708 TaxID=3346916 RepID=UPI0036BCA87A
MAKTLDFFDLKEAATRNAAEGLTLKGPDGVVHLRPIMLLPKADLKAVYAHIDAVQSKNISELGKIDAMDNALVAAADHKDALKAMLDELPLSARLEIFEGWMEAAEVPEA